MSASAYKVGRWIVIIAFLVSGITHLVAPESFLPLMPPVLPEPIALIVISGFAEIIAAVGLIFKVQFAPQFTFLVLLAVWPANWWLAIELTSTGEVLAAVFAWLRLPLQIPLFLFALRSPVSWYFIPKRDSGAIN